jgi:hypothetical protein
LLFSIAQFFFFVRFFFFSRAFYVVQKVAIRQRHVMLMASPPCEHILC